MTTVLNAAIAIVCGLFIVAAISIYIIYRDEVVKYETVIEHKTIQLAVAEENNVALSDSIVVLNSKLKVAKKRKR